MCAADAEVRYTLRYQPRVIDEDRKRITAATWSRIGRAIADRLTTAPERYGEPLAGSLRGFRKLRVGDYRVIFQVLDSTVYVLGIWHRHDAYQAASRRLGR